MKKKENKKKANENVENIFKKKDRKKEREKEYKKEGSL